MFDSLFQFDLLSMILIPIYTAIPITLWLLVKPQSEQDRLFRFSEEDHEEAVYRRIDQLEKVKGRPYHVLKSKVDQAVTTCRKKKLRFSRTYSSRFNELINLQYFDGFKNRWKPFFLADTLVKIQFFSSLTGGVFASALMLTYTIDTNKSMQEDYESFGWLIYILMIPLSVLFSFMLMYPYVMFLHFVSMIFPRGSIKRANVCLEEMVNSAKIGGRDAIVFGGNWNDKSGSGYFYYSGRGGGFSGGSGGWGGFGGGSSGGGGAGGSW